MITHYNSQASPGPHCSWELACNSPASSRHYLNTGGGRHEYNEMVAAYPGVGPTVAGVTGSPEAAMEVSSIHSIEQ